ncbi:hypothetical protein GOV11_02945 [Candidatus Woesearchaeota archaeon]|nr:hypothetical protein [Candidatus Woesearchaeota archaeon]
MRILTTLVLAILILALPVQAIIYADDPGFRGCVIKWSNEPGQFDDIDCDRVPDVFDNCPLTPNPAQVDVDENGIGDYCDLIIDAIRVEPESPMQGRSMVVSMWLLNNRPYPMRNVIAKVEVPHLGIAGVEEVYEIKPGERRKEEVVLRVPECAPTRFVDVVAIVEYPFAPGQAEIFSQNVKVPIVSSGLCSQEPGIDKTIVDILEIQDVDPVTGATYPFSITNAERESKAYILSVSGMENWGWVEMLPGSVIILGPGESKEGEIRVWAFPGQPEASYSFTFTVNARNDIKQVVLLADVEESPQNYQVTSGGQIMFGLLIFLVILLFLSLVLMFLNKSHKRKIKKRR